MTTILVAPHGSALRKGRVSEVGRVYLVTTITQGRAPLFADWRMGRLVVAEMRASQDGGWVESLAWVLMPDHLHWLFALREGELDGLMRRVKSRSAIEIRRGLGGEGRVWQKGYHDHAARRDEDVRALARYVVANPLRAGLVRTLGDYPLWDAAWL
jgi:putative transposase